MSTNLLWQPSSSIERGTIYMVGYADETAETQVERFMRLPRALLVDIRFSPRSRWYPLWNRTALERRYGHQYLWEPRLGNVHYQHKDLGIQLDEGHEDAVCELAVLLVEGVSLILLCACKNPRTCHRSLVAKLIQDVLPAPRQPEEVRA